MKNENVKKNTINCFTCKHMTISTPWKCGNKKAIELRKTSNPNASYCEFWRVDVDFVKPIKTEKNDKPIAMLG
jgi:hypothetical protein